MHFLKSLRACSPLLTTPNTIHHSTRMTSASLQFTTPAKQAILSIESSEERVETILFLLQTAIEDCAPPIIRCADVRTAQLMIEMRLHLLDGIDS